MPPLRSSHLPRLLIFSPPLAAFLFLLYLAVQDEITVDALHTGRALLYAGLVLAWGGLVALFNLIWLLHAFFRQRTSFRAIFHQSLLAWVLFIFLFAMASGYAQWASKIHDSVQSRCKECQTRLASHI